MTPEEFHTLDERLKKARQLGAKIDRINTALADLRAAGCIIEVQIQRFSPAVLWAQLPRIGICDHDCSLNPEVAAQLSGELLAAVRSILLRMLDETKKQLEAI